MKNIIDIYESILDNIDDNIKNSKEYNELAHTFNWIVGFALTKDFRVLKGGTRYNIERLIGKKHKNNYHYIGPLMDRIMDGKPIHKNEYSFKTHIYSWLESIILETKFKKLIEEYGEWEICSEIKKQVTEKLNDLLIDKNGIEQFDVHAMYSSYNKTFDITISIKTINEKYNIVKDLVEFSFITSEYWKK